MKYIVINPKGEETYTSENQKEVTLKLLEILWNKHINGVKSITRTSYNYNYSDKQRITFYSDNKYKYIFEGIPTKWGSLDTYNIEI